MFQSVSNDEGGRRGTIEGSRSKLGRNYRAYKLTFSAGVGTVDGVQTGTFPSIIMHHFFCPFRLLKPVAKGNRQ